MKKKSVSKDALTAEHPLIKKKIDKTLKQSHREGAFASISINLGLSYLSPFAIFMNATSSQIGVLYAITNLLPSIVQIWASDLMEVYSRKKIVITTILIRAILWIPILLTGVLFYLGDANAVVFLIVLASLFYIANGLALPVWFSWMGSIVPEQTRGQYFSKRNRIIGFAGIITMVLAALILDGMKRYGEIRGDVILYTLIGFCILFGAASLSRFWTAKMIGRHYEPRLKIRKKDEISLFKFLKNSPRNAFGKFALYRGAFSFAAGISAPFWTVYMLRDLGFSYFWFMAVTVSGVVFQLMFLPLLGKATDRFGNVAIMRLCSAMLFMSPLLWFFSSFIDNKALLIGYLLVIPSMISGFGWAGYRLAANDYVFDAMDNRRRSYGISYMNFLVGLGLFLGAGVGSLITLMEVSFMNSLLLVFLISSAVRLAVVIFGVHRLDEVRHVRKFNSHYLVREFHPAEGMVREVHHVERFMRKVEHYI